MLIERFLIDNLQTGHKQPPPISGSPLLGDWDTRDLLPAFELRAAKIWQLSRSEYVISSFNRSKSYPWHDHEKRKRCKETRVEQFEHIP